MHDATLCIPLEEEHIRLAMKKRGFGAGRYNGYGGKPEAGESIEDAAVREFYEESGVRVKKEDLVKVGEVEFYFPHKPNWDQKVHIYTVRQWEGDFVETEEMRPGRFHHSEIPYSQMWPDDEFWLPHVLAGKYVMGSIVFGEGDTILENRLEIRES